MVIEKFIVHILDKDQDTPVLNEYELKINAESDKFLRGVIKKIMKDDNLRKASFNEINDNIVYNCSDQMVYNADTFLENSKEIASYLFEVMSTDAELDTCDLAICMFSEKDERYVAILKLDYKKSYAHSVEFIDDKFLINFVLNSVGISESIKPKHCAIIKGYEGVNDEYQLYVIDEGLTKANEPSRFITEFLDVAVIEDDKYRTKVFKNATETWIANALSDDVKRAEDIRSMLNYTLKEKEEINIDGFIENCTHNEDLKDSFKEHMEYKGLDGSFDIDKKWVEKNLKNRNIKTDNGFVIKGKLMDFEDPMKYSVRQNSNGTIDIVIKNIKYIEG